MIFRRTIAPLIQKLNSLIIEARSNGQEHKPEKHNEAKRIQIRRIFSRGKEENNE